jgi:creatinine amidohydrolase/Fe(II)-dependent formamide hydrolase-like protein
MDGAVDQESMTDGDPLALLEVIDLLEVGPIKIEPKRITAPYRVSRGGSVDETELSYRYEEDVLDPADLADRNLASLAAVQVALNYGLFCRRMVFSGLWEERDRRFLEAMLQNTAREIFVNKLLLPNPFIQGEAAHLPVVKKKSYCRATLELIGETPAGLRSWSTRRSRSAVLSSGGKDSLLTYGLMAELGEEIHPIFVNESGRHWFTALNAHRYFVNNVANTTRVWTSSDRVFSWMLRHLPFVRRDHANIRSDAYPIRLWTVPVFIFGALPLLKKRGIGRLLIGDEYDTTQIASHRGIQHHSGLYDQGRHFDAAVTRYYHHKRWGVSQFSILRPLSELLIEKILAERYPHLLSQQVSCHATHTQDHRVMPCGKCEKCRRIVGMLQAIGIDPVACGYSPAQIDRCLLDLAAKGIHQERAGTEHLGYILSRKRLLSDGRIGAIKAYQRPEVEKLRFDGQRSPWDTTPAELRARLWRIFLEHAAGAVVRKGRVWTPVDPLTDAAALSSPYPFEAAAKGTKEPTGDDRSVLAELTWPAAERRLREVDLALLPVGSIEQHGPHLPLDTDAFDADYLARQVAAGCSSPRPLVLPLIPYGVAYHHQDFSGTLSIGPDTLAKVVYEIGISVANQGITKLVIINGHGGNAPALKFAAQLINRDANIFTAVDTGETSDADIAQLIETRSDVHAGEVETSTALATRAHLVDMERATSFVPEFSSRYLDFSSKRSVEWYARTAKISPSGVMGDPSKASVDKGRRIWAVMIKNLIDFVEQLKGMTLDEIYQKRY